MKKAFFYTITLIIPILLLLSFPAWSVPGLINYQGKLTDPNGISLNGSYTMKFYLYNAESDGIPLWNEQQDVTVTNGIYNVELGKISSFPSDLFDNENLYLEVEILGLGMDWETLSPRQPLTSTPFAMKAGYATTAAMVDGFQVSELEESEEINNKIAIHVQDASAHHPKTTSFTELTDMATDDQVPDDITVNYAKDADKVDGKHASEFGDGHSLDAVDGNPVDVVYVDANGNVGISTTNPSSLLHLSAINPWIRMTDVGGGDDYGFINNTLGLGVLNFAVYNLTDSKAELSFDGTGNVIIGNGNVGIGTTSPECKLHVVDATAHPGISADPIRIESNPYTYTGINLKNTHSDGQGNADSWSVLMGTRKIGGYDNLPPSSFAIREHFTSSNYYRFVIDDSGNVGIGTTSPSEKLEVVGNAIISGNVGIGLDTGQTSKFHVVGYSGTTSIDGISVNKVAYLTDGINAQDGSIAGSLWIEQKDEIIYLRGGRNNNGGIAFATRTGSSNYERMRIANSGNIGIGTTSPAEKLHVYGTGAPIIAQIECDSDDTAQLELKGDGVKWAVSKRRGPENNRLAFYYHDGASWSPGLLTLEPSGNVGIGTTSPQQKMHISGVMRLEPQSSPPSGALGDLYVGTDGKLYFHNGTQWKEVSLI